jgi:DNA-binding NarL/FixJ family response regulator
MTTQLPKTAAAPRIRVGLLGLAPLRVIGLQALFQDHAEIEIALAEGHMALHDPKLRVLLVGADSGPSLLGLLAAVKAKRPDLRVIVLSSATDEEAILKEIAAGAKGHLHDAATAAEVQQAIQIVAAGSVWAPRRVLSLLIERMTQAPLATPPSPSVSFTLREREVLELLIAGRSNKEISKALRIEVRTVKAHVGRLMRKVGVQGRTALTMHVMTHALLDLPQ